MKGLPEAKKRIKNIYDRRRAAVYAYCMKWGSEMLKYFQRMQPATPGAKGAFWTNRTGIAAATWFYNVFFIEDSIILRAGHSAEYGVYLELANNRAHESIRPIIQRYAGRLLRDIKELYAG